MKNLKRVLTLIIMITIVNISSAQSSTDKAIKEIEKAQCNVAKSINESVKENKAAKYVNDKMGDPAGKAEKGFCKNGDAKKDD